MSRVFTNVLILNELSKNYDVYNIKYVVCIKEIQQEVNSLVEDIGKYSSLCVSDVSLEIIETLSQFLHDMLFYYSSFTKENKIYTLNNEIMASSSCKLNVTIKNLILLLSKYDFDHDSVNELQKKSIKIGKMIIKLMEISKDSIKELPSKSNSRIKLINVTKDSVNKTTEFITFVKSLSPILHNINSQNLINDYGNTVLHSINEFDEIFNNENIDKKSEIHSLCYELKDLFIDMMKTINNNVKNSAIFDTSILTNYTNIFKEISSFNGIINKDQENSNVNYITNNVADFLNQLVLNTNLLDDNEETTKMIMTDAIEQMTNEMSKLVNVCKGNDVYLIHDTINQFANTLYSTLFPLVNKHLTDDFIKHVENFLMALQAFSKCSNINKSHSEQICKSLFYEIMNYVENKNSSIALASFLCDCLDSMKTSKMIIDEEYNYLKIINDSVTSEVVCKNINSVQKYKENLNNSINNVMLSFQSTSWENLILLQSKYDDFLNNILNSYTEGTLECEDKYANLKIDELKSLILRPVINNINETKCLINDITNSSSDKYAKNIYYVIARNIKLTKMIKEYLANSNCKAEVGNLLRQHLFNINNLTEEILKKLEIICNQVIQDKNTEQEAIELTDKLYKEYKKLFEFDLNFKNFKIMNTNVEFVFQGLEDSMLEFNDKFDSETAQNSFQSNILNLANSVYGLVNKVISNQGDSNQYFEEYANAIDEFMNSGINYSSNMVIRI